jgi:DNA-directed RNA polymerase specialized sigma24 family protein
MEVPPQGSEPRVSGQAKRLEVMAILGDPPDRISERSSTAWRASVELACDLLTLSPTAFEAAIQRSKPGELAPGVLVLCIRYLTRSGRIEEAFKVVACLCGTIGPPEQPRYRYLGRLRSKALKAAPQDQFRYDGEDLFQEAVVRIQRELHTNSSAVTAWPYFCEGRLRSVQKEWAGRKGEKLRRERTEASLPLLEGEDGPRSVFDQEFQDPPIAGSTEEDLESLVMEVLEDICTSAPEVERPVLRQLWFSDEARSVNDVAKQLEMKPDRVRNIRLDAGKRALEAISARGHPALDHRVLANVWASLPRRRGSKPARIRRT